MFPTEKPHFDFSRKPAEIPRILLKYKNTSETFGHFACFNELNSYFESFSAMVSLCQALVVRKCQRNAFICSLFLKVFFPFKNYQFRFFVGDRFREFLTLKEIRIII